jgi:nitrite reductase/ring-hydroxylating ferredoxin subunit
VSSEPPKVMAIPRGLPAPGTAQAAWREVAALADLPLGAMARFTRGDLDLLVANTPAGILVTDDRCPHMAAPLSQGQLDGLQIECPLHSGRFDLASGETLQFPTTGGLDADGGYHPPWAPPGSPPRPEPTDAKARARALTRVRRMRFYPVRISGDRIEAAIPD